MATHVVPCVVCGVDCYCCNDEHALGCGGPDGHGGCKREPLIEFCSLACAEELKRRVTASIEHYHKFLRGED